MIDLIEKICKLAQEAVDEASQHQSALFKAEIYVRALANIVKLCDEQLEDLVNR
jgi:hypothetical protein